MYGVSSERLQPEIAKYVKISSMRYENITFSREYKEILKRTLDLAGKSGNTNILFEHLFLSVITDKTSNIQMILDKFNFDYYASRDKIGRAHV